MMKNPFVDVFHWTKGQILDLAAISEAIVGRQNIAKQEAALTGKKLSLQKDLDNLNAGKKTMGTLFKSQSDAGNLANTLESTEREIQATCCLKDLLTIYIGDTIIPKFKKEKLDLYGQISQQFHVLEINNASNIANFWSKLLQNDNVKQSTE